MVFISVKNDSSTTFKQTSEVNKNYDTQNCDILFDNNLFDKHIILH